MNMKKIIISRHIQKSRQQGVTLMELMVGIAIGLLVVAVAAAALMVSRGVSSTVTDATDIQQQAAYAMRTIGQQLRQSGSLVLDLNPSATSSEAAGSPALVPVGLKALVGTAGGGMDTFDPATNMLSGASSPVSLTVGYLRDRIPAFPDGAQQYYGRNCVGGPADTATDARLESILTLVDNELLCQGNGGTAQAMVQNVANFQVRYLLQDNTTTPGNPKIQYVSAGSVPKWSRVQAVEVCLVLYGKESIDMPSGASYTDCDGTTQVDMTTLTGVRAKRMHIAFRNSFQLRSQGLVGSVL